MGKRRVQRIILVADDSPAVLDKAQLTLEQSGYNAVGLDDGRQLQKRARKLKPELLLLASYLDTIDVFTLCKELGEDAQLASLPIVIMHNRGEVMSTEFTRELGVVDHISKPFEPEALLAVVQHVLDKTQHRTRAAISADSQQGTPATRLASALSTALGKAPDIGTQAERLRELAEDGQFRVDLETLLGSSRHVAMTGDLSVVPLAGVLQMLSMQRQSGFLKVRHSGRQVSLALKDGAIRLVTGENMPDELLLGNILVRENLIEERELNMLLSSRSTGAYRLGSQVVALGHLTQEQLHKALRLQSAELVYELLRWGAGKFVLEPLEKLPEWVLEFDFGLGTDELLMEGFRRVDEWGLIESAIFSFDAVPRRVAGGDKKAGPGGFNDKEQQVLKAIDGSRSVREIIGVVGWGTFEVARVLYGLIAARVLSF